MLMKRSESTSRGITGYIEPTSPVSMIPGQRAAANTASIAMSEMLARSQRRQRRAAQNRSSNVSGWTIRSW